MPTMKTPVEASEVAEAAAAAELSVGGDTPSFPPSQEKPAVAESSSGGSPPTAGKVKKKRSHTLRKAPQAPKRFKSSYICFFMAKRPEIKKALGDEATITSVSKKSAEMWRNLAAEEKVHWDEVAAKDKQRYLTEKAMYTGPWQVPYKRARKDPSAPKRPMSAFLYFSQARRKDIKEKNPEMRNTEISRELGKEWRKVSEDVRKPYVDREKKEREKYKVEIAKWREEQEKKEAEMKKEREEQRKLYEEEMAKNPALQHQQGGAAAAAAAGASAASAGVTHQYPGYPPHAGAWPHPFMYYQTTAQQGEDASSSYHPPPFGSSAPAPQVLGPSGMPQSQPQHYYPYPYPPHPGAQPPASFEPNVASDQFQGEGEDESSPSI